MLRRCLALLLGLVICVGPAAHAQDKKKDAPPSKEKGDDAKKDDTTKDDKEEMKKDDKGSAPSGRLRGMLPPNYRRLGLTEDQRQKIYRVQAEFDDKIKEMEDRIAKLKAEKNKAVEGVLTDAQRARLKEILGGK